MRLPDAADWYTGDGREFTLGGRTHTESPSVAPDSPYSSTEQRSAMQRLLDDDLSEFGGGDGPNSMHSFHMEDAIRRVHALSVLGGAGGAGGAGPGGAASAPASYLGGSHQKQILTQRDAKQDSQRCLCLLRRIALGRIPQCAKLDF